MMCYQMVKSTLNPSLIGLRVFRFQVLNSMMSLMDPMLESPEGLDFSKKLLVEKNVESRFFQHVFNCRKMYCFDFQNKDFSKIFL